MSVKLSGRLPKDELSGMDRITSSLLKYPGRYRVVVGLVDCSRVTVDHTGKQDLWTPTARLVAVEPVTDRDQVNDALDVLVQAHQDRIADIDGMEVEDTGVFQQMADQTRTDTLDDEKWTILTPQDDEGDQ